MFSGLIIRESIQACDLVKVWYFDIYILEGITAGDHYSHASN